MQTVIDFFNHPFFIIVGGLTTFVFVIGIFYRIITMFIGVTPIVLRLGFALWGREVAIFSSEEAFKDLESSLLDSKIFKNKNIIHIRPNNIEKSKKKTIFLVDWDSFGDKIEQVFNSREDEQTPVIIYAKPQSIALEKMNDIANRPNTVVVNFKGRLLNDILTSLITTSYE
jgi:hypothetical protein